MSKMQDPTEKTLAPGLYASPWSKAYWKDAAKELTKVRMLVIAAVLIAVRVALKSVAIPIAPPTLMLNLGFFVNALGAMIFGPVVAIVAAAISDTLGCILFPTGVYFFPFIFTEIAGSLIFALFLYRAPLTNARVIWSRFCVCFLVNIVIQTPIMLLYYQMILGKSYAIFDLPRILKNLVMFPIESVLLILFLDVMTPVTYRMQLTYSPPSKMKLAKRQVALLLTLLIVGGAATGGYAWYDYNTRNHITSMEKSEREDLNRTVAGQLPEGLEENQILVTSKLTKTAFRSEETVTFYIYSVAEGANADELWGLKNSEAKKDESLTCVASGTAVLDRDTKSLVSAQVKPEE